MKKTLVWNNKKAEDMGLKIISLPPIQLSSERVTEVPLIGRDGFLTEADGYDGDTKQVEADLKSVADPLKLLSWLKGSGEVIFGNMDDRYYKARINNIVPLSQIIEKQLYYCPIEFRCQPFGYLLDGKEEITLTTGTTLNHNKATHKSLPTIIINGTGACSFTINSRTFNISDIGGSIKIISDIEQVANDKGDKMTGLFPYFDVGENILGWTGNVTSVIVQANWRCK